MIPTLRMRTLPAPPVRTAKRSCRTLPLLPPSRLSRDPARPSPIVMPVAPRKNPISHLAPAPYFPLLGDTRFRDAPAFRMRTLPAPPVRTAKRSCRTLPLLPRVPSVARSGAPQSGRDAHGGLEKTRRFPRKVDFQAARGPRWDTLRNNRFPHRKGSRNAFSGPRTSGTQA